MTTLTTPTESGVTQQMARANRITAAFMRLGIAQMVAYPLATLLTDVIRPLAMPVMYVFLAKLVPDSATTGNDYFTFVAIGFIGNRLLEKTVIAFGREVDSAIQQGRLETFLIQPISWYTLPFALASWPIVESILVSFLLVGVSMLFGMSIEPSGIPVAVLIYLLGIAASHAVGTIAASVRLLSKQADPVVTIYTLGTMIFSGTLFGIDQLPGWLRIVSYMLPQTFVLTATRQVLMTDGDLIYGPSLGISILCLVVGTVVLYVIGLVAFGRSIQFGRRYGILGDY